MARMPSSPHINWNIDGTPIAAEYDDIYFSVEDGLEESRAVFLQACELPNRWRNRRNFTIAETGFGTGLNFLAAWQAWDQSEKRDNAWLDFVSFEGHPLHQRDAKRALSHWPELQRFSNQLIKDWPHPARGTRRIIWPAHNIRLTLYVDDIQTALPQASFKADAWFLDGFSPAKNETMWGDWIYPLIAERSAAGARLGTFTVAGQVRRGLQGAGFDVTKAPGHGRKRERLEAEYMSAPEYVSDIFATGAEPTPPKRVAIIGAGIAGASVALALSRFGAEITVFDSHDTIANGASGNPLALLMPRLDAEDNPTARLLTDAYVFSRDAYSSLDGAHIVEVNQTPRDEKEKSRIAKVLNDPPLPLEDLEQLRAGGLLHKNALILEPAKIIEQLLRGANLHLGKEPKVDVDTKTVGGETFDAIVLANSMGTIHLLPWLNMIGRLGQVDYVDDLASANASAIASGHYALASGTIRLWGATFEDAGSDPSVSVAAREKNAAALKELSPWWLRQIDGAHVQSRAGIRATTADRLPLIGPAIDVSKARDLFAEYRHGRLADVDAPRLNGVYITSGFGSRGFTWGPWAGEVIASQLFGAPAPTAQSVLQCVSPMRYILRAIKRGT